MTNHEMELHYTQTKCIYMEGKEPCRIPVPVDRCPLNKLSMVTKNFTLILAEDIFLHLINIILFVVERRWRYRRTSKGLFRAYCFVGRPTLATIRHGICWKSDPFGHYSYSRYVRSCSNVSLAMGYAYYIIHADK